jgi:hypothetical protein
MISLGIGYWILNIESREEMLFYLYDNGQYAISNIQYPMR